MNGHGHFQDGDLDMLSELDMRPSCKKDDHDRVSERRPRRFKRKEADEPKAEEDDEEGENALESLSVSTSANTEPSLPCWDELSEESPMHCLPDELLEFKTLVPPTAPKRSQGFK